MKITIDLGGEVSSENIQNIALADNMGSTDEQAIVAVILDKIIVDLDRRVKAGQKRREEMAIDEKTRANRSQIRGGIEG